MNFPQTYKIEHCYNSRLVKEMKSKVVVYSLNDVVINTFYIFFLVPGFEIGQLLIAFLIWNVLSYFKFHLYFETLFIVSYHKSSDFHISSYYKVILQYNYKIKHLWILLFISCYMYLFLDIFVICLQGVSVCFLCFVKEQENLNYPSSSVCVCVS